MTAVAMAGTESPPPTASPRAATAHTLCQRGQAPYHLAARQDRAGAEAVDACRHLRRHARGIAHDAALPEHVGTAGGRDQHDEAGAGADQARSCAGPPRGSRSPRMPPISPASRAGVCLSPGIPSRLPLDRTDEPSPQARPSAAFSAS